MPRRLMDPSVVEGLAMPNVLPATPMAHRYWQVRATNRGQHHEEAKDVAAKPERLAADFAASVDLWAASYKTTLSLKGGTRDGDAHDPHPTKLASGLDLQIRLRNQKRLDVAGKH